MYKTSNHVHREEIDGHGKAVCRCGRVQQYDTLNPNNPPTLLKAGEANYQDKITEALPSTANELPVPERPIGRDLPWRYFEDNKQQILADYERMISREFLLRWHISTRTWQLIRKRWGVVGKMPQRGNQGKLRSYSHKKSKMPQTTEKATPLKNNWSGIQEADLGKAGVVMLLFNNIDIFALSTEQRRWLFALVDKFKEFENIKNE